MREKLHARISLGLMLAFAGVLFWRYPAQYQTFHSAPPRDFAVFLTASDLVAHGQNPYLHASDLPYIYPPVLIALIRLLPSDPAQAWLLFSSICVSLLLLTLWVGGRYNSWRATGLLVLGLILSWKGIIDTLDSGQLEIIILAIAVSAGAMRIRHPVWAGLLAGSLPWLKLPWALVLFPMILSPVTSLTGLGRKPKRVRLFISGYFFSWFIWGAAVPSVVFGSDRAMLLTRSWIDALLAQPLSLYLTDVNQSAWATALRWFGGSPWLALAAVALLGGFLLGSLTARSLKITANREVFGWLTPWLILIQLLNPLSWRWGSVFLIGVPFSIAVITASVGKTLWRSLLVISVTVFWALQLNPVAQALGFGHWSDLHGYGILTAYWLGLLLLCLEAQPYWPLDSAPISGEGSGNTG